MKIHLTCLLLGFMLLSTLVLPSCTDDTEMTAVTPTADPETPKYGGTHNTLRLTNWSTWDYAAGTNPTVPCLIGEELLGGDWSRGPAGSGENDWSCGYGGFTDTLTGRIAESWEMPDNETFLYHIRPGVRWWNIPPADGRELTADDVVWNIERHFSSELSANYAMYTATGKNPTAVTAVDNLTVKVTVLPEYQGLMASVIGDHLWLLCPDAVDANNGAPITD